MLAKSCAIMVITPRPPPGRPLNSEENGRGERIRTSGPCLPKTVLYQAELLPDRRSREDPGRGRGGPIGMGCRAGKRAFGVVADVAMDAPATHSETHWEWQYLDLMRRVWEEVVLVHGTREPGGGQDAPFFLFCCDDPVSCAFEGSDQGEGFVGSRAGDEDGLPIGPSRVG